ncbi:LytTR family DNA-binding domain-containing protein [Neolewinella lacunae]|uniref:Response regulator transcription factor n=1 Tax=Neolewinella lacunae TaxID=1517758 RepID=A0A923PNX7_9BACT|nr:LytTR family DNA-binding domain-containing protein [Neolewinella lacunae]MBC6994728.1 response regulator transcription factor [Neolewinella lacunae]MDN3634600.1 LytTR family DNA-binding domain-containing protein [Neolewinella lacunae]
MDALILDDERASAETLLILLSKYCPEVKVVGLCTDATDALTKAHSLRPNLFFVDVDLVDSTGFDFQRKITYPTGFIFTTAHEQFAHLAFKADAIDYLLKPIDPVDLVRAVEKARQRLVGSAQPDTPLSASPPLISRIAVPVADGIIFLKLASVIRFEAQGSYTLVIQDNGKTLLLSKNLAALEEMTKYGGFKRVHRSHLVNMAFVEKFLRGEGGELCLYNGERIPVARNRRDDFMNDLF